MGITIKSPYYFRFVDHPETVCNQLSSYSEWRRLTRQGSGRGSSRNGSVPLPARNRRYSPRAR
jgi:hypothetical protein